MNVITNWLLLCILYTLGKSSSFEDLRVVTFDTTGAHSNLLPTSRAISNIDATPNCSEISGNYVEGKTMKAQLLRLIQEPEIPVYHCRVRWSMTTKRCKGYFWKYASTGKVLFYDQYLEVPRQACVDLITKGTAPVMIDDKYPVQIQASLFESTTQLHIISGEEYPDGTCNGGNLNVLGNKERSQIFTVETNTDIGVLSGHYLPHQDQIIIPGGPRIRVSQTGFHSDNMHGQHYYNISDIPKDSCDFHRSISVGNLTIYEPNSQELDLQKVLNFETHDNLSLTVLLHEETTICGRLSYITSEPNLFITPLRNKDLELNVQNEIRSISVEEVSKLDELNARISTLTLKLSMKVETDINALVGKVCTARLESLKNHYNLLAIYGGGPGLSLGSGQPGVEIINQGAVSFLVFGVKMIAKLRKHEDTCCEQLPVTILDSEHKHTNVFIDPRTSIIMPFCTPRACNAAMPFYYRTITVSEDQQETVVWLCTRGSPEIVTCQEPPLILDVMSKKFKSKIQELISRDINRATIYSPELIHQHHVAKLTGLAREAIIARTAHQFTQQYGNQLPNLVSSHSAGSGMINLKDEILSGVGNYYHSYIQAGYFVGGTILAVISLIVIYKIWIYSLKLTSGEETKKFGFDLGSKRQIKAIRRDFGNIEEELVQLKGVRARELEESCKVADYVSSLAERISEVECKNRKE